MNTANPPEESSVPAELPKNDNPSVPNREANEKMPHVFKGDNRATFIGPPTSTPDPEPQAPAPETPPPAEPNSEN